MGQLTPLAGNTRSALWKDTMATIRGQKDNRIFGLWDGVFSTSTQRFELRASNQTTINRESEVTQFRSNVTKSCGIIRFFMLHFLVTNFIFHVKSTWTNKYIIASLRIEMAASCQHATYRQTTKSQSAFFLCYPGRSSASLLKAFPHH